MGSDREVADEAAAYREMTILEHAEAVVNGPRRVEYGGVLQSFERIAAKWSVTLGVPVTAEQVGLCMIDLKTVRALQGWHRDSYVDIAGYARCIELMQDEREPVDTRPYSHPEEM